MTIVGVGDRSTVDASTPVGPTRAGRPDQESATDHAFCCCIWWHEGRRHIRVPRPARREPGLCRGRRSKAARRVQPHVGGPGRPRPRRCRVASGSEGCQSATRRSNGNCRNGQTRTNRQGLGLTLIGPTGSTSRCKPPREGRLNHVVRSRPQRQPTCLAMTALSQPEMRFVQSRLRWTRDVSVDRCDGYAQHARLNSWFASGCRTSRRSGPRSARAHTWKGRRSGRKSRRGCARAHCTPHLWSEQTFPWGSSIQPGRRWLRSQAGSSGGPDSGPHRQAGHGGRRATGSQSKAETSILPDLRWAARPGSGRCRVATMMASPS